MKNQFQTLKTWLPDILHLLKREIKTEHLSKNPHFYRTYFGSRPLSRLTNEEIIAGYEKELLQGNEELSEWIVNRWVFNHGEIYRHFAERLSKIHENFDQIKTLDEKQSEEILKGAEERFGALPIYIFSVLNGVVFPEKVLEKMRAAAELHAAEKKSQVESAAAKENLDQIIARHQRELSRLQEKHEDRIAGIMKKYSADIEALKKQIRALQLRLQPKEPAQ